MSRSALLCPLAHLLTPHSSLTKDFPSLSDAALLHCYVCPISARSPLHPDMANSRKYTVATWHEQVTLASESRPGIGQPRLGSYFGNRYHRNPKSADEESRSRAQVPLGLSWKGRASQQNGWPLHLLLSCFPLVDVADLIVLFPLPFRVPYQEWTHMGTHDQRF